MRKFIGHLSIVMLASLFLTLGTMMLVAVASEPQVQFMDIVRAVGFLLLTNTIAVVILKYAKE